MHVTDLDDQPSPLAASSAPPFHPRSAETSSWRLTRLAADLGNGITQQTPNPPRPLGDTSGSNSPCALATGRPGLRIRYT